MAQQQQEEEDEQGSNGKTSAANMHSDKAAEFGGRKTRGPTRDLMGPSIQQDMALGAQYSRKAVSKLTI